MSIILLILKIIGIILLVILGLLVLLILAVLLIPLRYRISGESGEDITVRLRVSWMRPCISWKARFEEKQFEQKLRIFGILLKKDKVDKKPQKAEEQKPATEKAEPKSKQATEKAEPKSKQATEKAEPKSKQATEKAEPKSKQATKKAEPESKQATEKTVPEERGRMAAIKAFFHKLKQLPGMIKKKLETLKEKSLQFKEILIRVRTELADETNRSAIRLLFTELKGLLRHFMPRRIQVDALFSAGEPDTTGQTLGVISMLPPMYHYKIHLCPDFEADKFYFNGTFDIRGHIRGVHALILLIHFIKDKNIRSLIQRYRNS